VSIKKLNGGVLTSDLLASFLILSRLKISSLMSSFCLINSLVLIASSLPPKDLTAFFLNQTANFESLLRKKKIVEMQIRTSVIAIKIQWLVAITNSPIIPPVVTML
jgi:hypothetical protein